MQRAALVRNPMALALGALGLVGLGAWGWMAWDEAQAAREREQREARAEREEAEREARRREESSALMPELLTGVALGMSVEEVRALGHHVTPVTGRESPTNAHLTMYEERLENGAQLMFGFADRSGELAQVQVMSLLPRVEAIAPHLQAMNERYGTPGGVWDCPDTQGLPTRRFTWRHSQTAISDVFLLYNGRVSLTLYIATPEAIGRSLVLSHCAPVPREALDRFPTASPEQIQRATQEGG